MMEAYLACCVLHEEQRRILRSVHARLPVSMQTHTAALPSVSATQTSVPAPCACFTAIIAYRVFGFPDGGITTTTPLVQYSGMGSPVPGTTKVCRLFGRGSLVTLVSGPIGPWQGIDRGPRASLVWPVHSAKCQTGPSQPQRPLNAYACLHAAATHEPLPCPAP